MEKTVKNNDFTTTQVAEKMLASGRFYSPSLLSLELGLSKQRAASVYKNIEAAVKYHTERKGLKGNQLMRVVSIDGCEKVNSSINDLWKTALFS